MTQPTPPADAAPLVIPHNVMRALVEHAKTLGWEIEEWNFRDVSDGSWSYEMWLRELDATEVQS